MNTALLARLLYNIFLWHLVKQGLCSGTKTTSSVGVKTNVTTESAAKEYGFDYITDGGDSYEDSDSSSENDGDYEYEVDDVANPGEGQPHMAFLMKTNGCSASLIHRDWLISASHCFEDYLWSMKKDEDGDDFVLNSKPRVYISGSVMEPTWAKPIEIKKRKDANVPNTIIWRKVEKVFTQEYKGLSKIYKGNDLVLIKLAPESETNTKKHYAPACLPDPSKPDFGEGDQDVDLYFAGYGRRRIPHCLTDGRGPDQYKVCGRPISCSHDHKTEECGIEFVYKGKKHTSCISQDTPSSENNQCVEILEKNGREDFEKKTYIMDDNNKLVTTCYPFKVGKGSKGWCATRLPWVDENTEPAPDAGWGFCGDDEMQSECNSHISSIVDTRLFPINHLNDKHCVEQLRLNLEYELPGIPEKDYADLEKSKIVCVGQNVTHTKDFDICILDKNGSCGEAKSEESIIKELTSQHDLEMNTIDQKVCFGDSGGPLLKFVGDKPVILGVMSYMLWGMCRSQYEPAFYTRVKSHLDFILRHVPQDEVCFA